MEFLDKIKSLIEPPKYDMFTSASSKTNNPDLLEEYYKTVSNDPNQQGKPDPNKPQQPVGQMYPMQQNVGYPLSHAVQPGQSAQPYDPNQPYPGQQYPQTGLIQPLPSHGTPQHQGNVQYQPPYQPGHLGQPGHFQGEAPPGQQGQFQDQGPIQRGQEQHLHSQNQLNQSGQFQGQNQLSQSGNFAGQNLQGQSGHYQGQNQLGQSDQFQGHNQFGESGQFLGQHQLGGGFHNPAYQPANVGLDPNRAYPADVNRLHPSDRGHPDHRMNRGLGPGDHSRNNSPNLNRPYHYDQHGR
ncbi:uncharacterized protein LOC135497193 [Lineus longissimus]|uniref:uncharacterized protein LOC135497193 n=1 Tax=Lineus longissimus TaxID=88925 RepID=UPI00315D3E92